LRGKEGRGAGETGVKEFVGGANGEQAAVWKRKGELGPKGPWKNLVLKGRRRGDWFCE